MPMNRAALAFALAAGLAGCADDPVPPLPALGIDPGRVAVAGLSSGAYMATQVHVALNQRIGGAALFAGGPYGCAGGDLDTALGPCMTAQPMPDAGHLAERISQRAAEGVVDDPAAFAGDRVLLFHGTRDTTVVPALAGVTAQVYRQLAGEALTLIRDDQRPVGHVFPTVDSGGDCVAGASPWLGRCDVDGAGLAMQTLFGQAEPVAEPSGTLQPFDQRAFFDEAGGTGLADAGYAYIPRDCARGGCGALLVFHGCQQSSAEVGEAFVRGAGFDRWADAHRVVVVYPQARASYLPLNPKACWDWWGYSGEGYDTRDGVQVRFVARLLDRLAQS